MKNKNLKYFFIVCFFCLQLTLHLQQREYALKTAFIEKFTRFTDWPKDIFNESTAQSIIVSVIGVNPFDKELDVFFDSQKIKNRNVKVRYIRNIVDISGSQILFICKSEKDNLSKILKFTKNLPILTIADTEGYAEKGVIINFYLSDDQIRFEINENALANSGLFIHYLLLNHARLVTRNGGAN
jgi:hypothetical protein